jgi:hypothetical protein
MATEVKVTSIKGARPAHVTITIQADGNTIASQTAMLRQFSSGKKGYGLYGKATLPNGEPIQMSVNLVVPHSES